MAIPDNLCVNLPRFERELPKVSLPLGAQLSAAVDFANGMPNDCSVALNLSGQLSAALGNIRCLMAVMEVFKVLQQVATNPPRFGELLEPLGTLAECFASITPAAICVTVKDILQAVIRIVSCVVDEIESIVEFQATLDVGAAANNPKLAGILLCAKGNADASAGSVLKVLEPLTALLGVVASLPGAEQLGIPQLPTNFQVSAATPSLADIADTSGIEAVLDVLRDIVNVLEQVVAAVPC